MLGLFAAGRATRAMCSDTAHQDRSTAQKGARPLYLDMQATTPVDPRCRCESSRAHPPPPPLPPLQFATRHLWMPIRMLTKPRGS